MNQRLSISLLLGVILAVSVFVAFALAGGSNGVALADDDVSTEAPDVGPITGPTDSVAVATEISVSAAFTDDIASSATDYVAEWNWGDGSTSPGDVADTPGSPMYSVTGSHTYTEPLVYSVGLKVTRDGSDPVPSEPEFVFVVVYDPEGGFVTGGGWINSPQGACQLTNSCTDATGKATFGFVSKYKKGANAPTGNTEFQFKAGDLNFHSDSYDWLVVAGHKAMYKGTGTVNRGGDYGFLLSAIDADLTPPSSDVDKFRIKIWDRNAGDAIVYDNQMGDSDDADASTEIGGGSIVIHRAK